MPNKVVHFKSIGPVTFFRNRRSKNMKISVKPDKSVLISFPFFVSEKEVLSFLERNESWIRKQQEKVSSRQQTFREGFFAKTKMHTLTLAKGHQTGTVDVKNYDVTVFIRDFQTESARDLPLRSTCVASATTERTGTNARFQAQQNFHPQQQTQLGKLFVAKQHQPQPANDETAR